MRQKYPIVHVCVKQSVRVQEFHELMEAAEIKNDEAKY